MWPTGALEYPAVKRRRPEGLEVQGPPQLHSKFEVSLDYVRFCLKEEGGWEFGGGKEGGKERLATLESMSGTQWLIHTRSKDKSTNGSVDSTEHAFSNGKKDFYWKLDRKPLVLILFVFVYILSTSCLSGGEVTGELLAW